MAKNAKIYSALYVDLDLAYVEVKDTPVSKEF